MKKWTVVAGVVLAAALVAIVPMTVLAAPKESTPNTDAARLKGALAIEGPRKAAVGEKITIRVTERATGDAVKDAGVWAVTKDAALAIKEKVAPLKEAGDRAAIEAAVESELNLHAIKIGTTNGDGKVHYAFERAGGYLLVAWKPGYFPGFRPILITRPAPKLMTIEAPFRAGVGQPVTIKVTERGIGKPVEGAGVWAIPKDAIQGLKDKLAALKQGSDPASVEAAVETELSASGFRIGTTDNSGRVVYAFQQPGGYLLVAWKPRYWPAFRPILIVPAPTAATPSTGGPAAAR